MFLIPIVFATKIGIHTHQHMFYQFSSIIYQKECVIHNCFQVTASLQAPHGYVGRPGLGSGAYNKCRCKNTAGYNVNKSITS
jgi:hypothetical protein